MESLQNGHSKLKSNATAACGVTHAANVGASTVLGGGGGAIADQHLISSFYKNYNRFREQSQLQVSESNQSIRGNISSNARDKLKLKQVKEVSR